MKRKLFGMVATVLTIATMTYAKEKTVNDGTIGKYVKIEIEKTGAGDHDAVEAVQQKIAEAKYEKRFPRGPQMKSIPEKNCKMLETEVTQKMYASVMGENPSYFKGDCLPVENVSWYDAVMFCNRLSEKEGLTPVYAVDGKTDTSKWNYTPHKGNSISGSITQNTSAPGYRLPTVNEWQHAARGGQNHAYAGSDNLDQVGWYSSNSGNITHMAGERKANGYGLYDMSGNVWEWCWDSTGSSRYYCGGGYNKDSGYCKTSSRDYGSSRYSNVGFRVTDGIENLQVQTNKDAGKREDTNVRKEQTSGGLVEMVSIPGKDFQMSRTEVTQGLYASVMGENPSRFKGDSLPVEQVSWYDAIVFCNRLSVKEGLTPVYAVDGKTDTSKWNYTPHKGNEIRGSITQNTSVNGYRLPTVEEWQYAARGGQSYMYAGSDNLDQVGWYRDNSGDRTHPVGEKKATGYGLYDMSGNVWEWCWDLHGSSNRCNCGGSYYSYADYCEVSSEGYNNAHFQNYNIGFRIVRSANR